jgi:hypothetical protein
MAVSVASTSVFAEATGTAATFTPPTGIVDGDLLIIWLMQFLSGGPGLASTPAGFAVLPTGTWPYPHPTKTDFTQNAWYKIASGESGDYVSTFTSCVSRGIMLRISGANTSTPFDGMTQNGGDTGASVTTFLGFSTTIDGDLIIAFNSDDNDAGTYGTTSGGMALPLGANTPGESSYYAVQTTHGAIANITAANRSSSNTAWFGELLAVQPSAAPTGQTILPDADITTTGWTPSTGTTLYGVLDDSSDTTYASATLS